MEHQFALRDKVATKQSPLIQMEIGEIKDGKALCFWEMNGIWDSKWYELTELKPYDTNDQTPDIFLL